MAFFTSQADLDVGIVNNFVLNTNGSQQGFGASVISEFDPTPALPVNPEIGDSYISLASARGWTVNHVMRWNGSEWQGQLPPVGGFVYTRDTQDVIVYDGTQFVPGISALNGIAGLANSTANTIPIFEDASGSRLAESAAQIVGNDFSVPGDITADGLNITTQTTTNDLQIAGRVLPGDNGNIIKISASSLLLNSNSAGNSAGGVFIRGTDIAQATVIQITTSTIVVGTGAAPGNAIVEISGTQFNDGIYQTGMITSNTNRLIDTINVIFSGNVPFTGQSLVPENNIVGATVTTINYAILQISENGAASIISGNTSTPNTEPISGIAGNINPTQILFANNASEIVSDPALRFTQNSQNQAVEITSSENAQLKIRGDSQNTAGEAFNSQIVMYQDGNANQHCITTLNVGKLTPIIDSNPIAILASRNGSSRGRIIFGTNDNTQTNGAGSILVNDYQPIMEMFQNNTVLKTIAYSNGVISKYLIDDSTNRSSFEIANNPDATHLGINMYSDNTLTFRHSNTNVAARISTPNDTLNIQVSNVGTTNSVCNFATPLQLGTNRAIFNVPIRFSPGGDGLAQYREEFTALDFIVPPNSTPIADSSKIQRFVQVGRQATLQIEVNVAQAELPAGTGTVVRTTIPSAWRPVQRVFAPIVALDAAPGSPNNIGYVEIFNFSGELNLYRTVNQDSFTTGQNFLMSVSYIVNN